MRDHGEADRIIKTTNAEDLGRRREEIDRQLKAAEERKQQIIDAEFNDIETHIFGKGLWGSKHVRHSSPYYSSVLVQDKERTYIGPFVGEPDVSYHWEKVFNKPLHQQHLSECTEEIRSLNRQVWGYERSIQKNIEAHENIGSYKKLQDECAAETKVAAAEAERTHAEATSRKQTLDQRSDKHKAIQQNLGQAEKEQKQHQQSVEEWTRKKQLEECCIAKAEQDIIRYQKLEKHYAEEKVGMRQKIKGVEKVIDALEDELMQMHKDQRGAREELFQSEKHIALAEAFQKEATQRVESKSRVMHELVVEKTAHDSEAQAMSAALSMQSAFATATEDINAEAIMASLINDLTNDQAHIVSLIGHQ